MLLDHLTGQHFYYSTVKQLFLILNFQIYTDSDFCNQDTNVVYSYYKTTICSAKYPAAPHDEFGKDASSLTFRLSKKLSTTL